MKLKHTVNFIKKHTVAIFVKVEKEEPKVCTFNEEYIKLFNSLVKDKYYTRLLLLDLQVLLELFLLHIEK